MANLITQWLDPNNFAILRDKFNAVVNALSGGTNGQIYGKYGAGDGESAWKNFLDLMPTGQPWHTFQKDLAQPPYSNKWVKMDGKTLGNGSSTADYQGSAYEALFLFIWNNFEDLVCPVSSGRGLDAEADYAANKKITLPDFRGVIDTGFDERVSDPSNGIWDVAYSSMGNSFGAKNITLTSAQSGSPALTVRDQFDFQNTSSNPPEKIFEAEESSGSVNSKLMAYNRTIAATVATDAHSNIPPVKSVNKIIKL